MVWSQKPFGWSEVWVRMPFVWEQVCLYEGTISLWHSGYLYISRRRFQKEEWAWWKCFVFQDTQRQVVFISFLITYSGISQNNILVQEWKVLLILGTLASQANLRCQEHTIQRRCGSLLPGQKLVKRALTQGWAGSIFWGPGLGMERGHNKNLNSTNLVLRLFVWLCSWEWTMEVHCLKFKLNLCLQLSLALNYFNNEI